MSVTETPETPEVPAEPTKPPKDWTIADQAHAIAELAYGISKRFKGFTTTDGLRAVEIAINSSLAQRALNEQGDE